MKRRSFFAAAVGAVAGLFGLRAKAEYRVGTPFRYKAKPRRRYLQTFTSYCHGSSSSSSSARWPEVRTTEDVRRELMRHGWWQDSGSPEKYYFFLLGNEEAALADGEWRTTITTHGGKLYRVSHWRIVDDPRAGYPYAKFDGLHSAVRMF